MENQTHNIDLKLMTLVIGHRKIISRRVNLWGHLGLFKSKKRLSSDFSHNFQHKLLLEQHRQNFRKFQNGWKRGNQNVFQDGWKSDSDVRVDWREDVAAWDSGPRGTWKLEPLGYVALEFCVRRHFSPVRSFHLSHRNHHERRIYISPTFTLIQINFLS